VRFVVAVKIKISKSLLKLDKNIKKAVNRGLNILATIAQNEAKKTKSFNDRTGVLRSDIVKDKDVTGNSIKVTAHAEYSGHVNDGTKYIRARKFMEEGEKAAENSVNTVMKNVLKGA
jgi:HK97 gp10 family phage protein